MSKLRALKAEILVEGQDLCIDEQDFARIREQLPADGRVPPDDLRVLVEMRTEARIVCAAFDKLFFPALKAELLTDGRISQAEQFLLLRMLYGGGGIDATERQFLEELRRDLRESTPEFESFYREAIQAK